MNLETYPIENPDPLIFTFVSKGKKGNIEKIVRYDLIEDGVYNLAFGDLNTEHSDFDDSSVSDNGDIIKVMATVIQTMPLFFEKHPQKKVSFEGSDKKRTNFYGWIIGKNILNWQDIYYIVGGFENGKIEAFRKGVDYAYFLIAKKEKK